MAAPFTYLAIMALAAAPAFAQDEPPFAASRPGETEGPIAVPAGYLQAETEIASYARDKEAGVTAKGLSIAATAFRYGLGDGYDAEVILQPYLRAAVNGPAFKTTDTGIGDVTVRVLKNLIGQRGDGPAVAVIGYVNLPTASNNLGADRLEGGAILSGSFSLADAWGAAWTVGAAARHVGTSGYHAELSGALQLNHAFSDILTGYAELAASRLQGESTAATFDVGAAWLTGPTTQFDLGANFGINDAADDANVFLGWAHRF
jgi:Putative MetA-pathway of phenol degradation